MLNIGEEIIGDSLLIFQYFRYAVIGADNQVILDEALFPFGPGLGGKEDIQFLIISSSTIRFS
jgi:hypothetical protein